TTRLDSTFLFSINAGSDTVDIDFWVRAVDDKNAKDKTPAYLKIPLKNTPPEAEFLKELIPSDSAFNLMTLTWEVNDADGINTLQAIELKINDEDWVSISPGRALATVMPDNPEASGLTASKLYYAYDQAGESIDGLELNAQNTFYIRALDIAGSYSQVDTLQNVFVRGKTSDLLLVSANSAQPDGFYKSNLNALSIDYDFIDFISNQASNQPPIWMPTFSLLLSQYEQVIMYANDVTFTNLQTKAEDIILEFASSSIQNYIEGGGKLFLSSSFPNGFSTGSALFGILPIDSLSTSQGQSRLPIDSMLIANVPGYPDLMSNTFISGLDPIYPSSDAQVIYTAQLTKNNGWEGPKNVGVTRSSGGNTNFVFFSVELHKINGDQTAINQLFDKVLNDEFNW
ncbi:MAG: hypothetical protein WEC59_07620, partial [Salibacteraceae bacterium]